METEPLQDTLPPRYAIESDDSEDEGDAIVKRGVPKAEPNVTLNWKGPQSKRQPLIVALDDAGKQWTNGVELGEAKGSVLVNDIEAASIFQPSWAEVAIVLTSVQLPLYAIHAFASMVIKIIRPTSVVIIDAYPVPMYISSSPPSPHPSIRYLRTSAASQSSLPNDIEPFHPPNIIQSPAASFLAILESKTNSTPATLLLLPSVHIPPPAPSDIGSRVGPEVHEEWETSTLVKLHKAANAVIGINTPWTAKVVPGRLDGGKVSRRGDIGEGGMYI